MCESKPSITDDMFTTMVNKAKEELKQRQSTPTPTSDIEKKSLTPTSETENKGDEKTAVDQTTPQPMEQTTTQPTEVCI